MRLTEERRARRRIRPRRCARLEPRRAGMCCVYELLDPDDEIRPYQTMSWGCSSGEWQWLNE